MTVSGFRVPPDVLTALGDGDLPLGFSVLCEVFGQHPCAHGFSLIPPETIRQIGNGSMSAGRQVLHKFVAVVRSQRTKTRAA